uniref:Uncharacterized protein n=1 Tax=Tetradesmus obliquus TaxID=3088 RepID=A0A383WH96_TETOB|eukprot:jgi/Sobl393_1/9476/SZX76494.1
MPRFANAEKTRKRNTDLIQKLQRLLNASINSHNNLQQENRLLQQEFQLLKSFCDGLEWLIQQTGSQADTAEEQLLLQQVGLHMEARTAAMQAEAAARRSGTDDTSSRTATDAPDRAGSSNSLSSSGDAAGSGSGSDVDAERDGPQTAAPAGDVTWLFRRVLAMPPVQGLEALSLADLTKEYTGMVKEMSLCVHFHEAAAASKQANDPSGYPAASGLWQADRIEINICRFLLMMYSLYLAKRQELVQALLLVNCDSLTLLQEPDKQHHAWVASQLGLSSEQQQQIAAGFRVFKRILRPTLEELKQLQLEQTGAEAAAAAIQMEQQQLLLLQQRQQEKQQQPQQQRPSSATPTSDSMQGSDDAAIAASSSASNAAAGEGSVPSLAAAAAQGAAMSAEFAPLSAAHVAYRQRLDEQERRSARISVLLRKDFLHRMLHTGYVYGCLSWYQQAKLMCLMFPYCPMPACFATVVTEAFEQAAKA